MNIISESILPEETPSPSFILCKGIDANGTICPFKESCKRYDSGEIMGKVYFLNAPYDPKDQSCESILNISID